MLAWCLPVRIRPIPTHCTLPHLPRTGDDPASGVPSVVRDPIGHRHRESRNAWLAGGGGGEMPTPSQEDYLKTIWLLIQRKGYARVSDIADALGVRSASVSKMVRRLHEDGLTSFEPYRGLNLTAKGRSRGRLLVERQRVLRLWLQTVGLGDGVELDRTVEEIEHYIHPETLVHVERLVRFIEGHPDWWGLYERTRGGQVVGPAGPAAGAGAGAGGQRTRPCPDGDEGAGRARDGGGDEAPTG